MSEPTEPTEPTRPIEPEEPDESDGTGRSGGSRRIALIAVVSVLVAAVLGAGAWAYVQLSGGGPQPADALPDSTIALVSVDLDPSASQKIAAIRTIRKIPDLRKQVDIDSKDDVRRWIFDKAVAGTDCGDLDFDDDVKPWLGNRAGFGAVDLGEDDPAPVLAIQVSDQGKARSGIERLAGCAGLEPFGYVIGDDYALISNSQQHARAIQAAAKKHPLADDPSYRTWNDEAGGRGVASFYVARKAADYLLDVLADELGSGADLGAVRTRLADFDGLAGTLRFHDGVELAMATSGSGAGSAVGDDVRNLPADTALALGLGVAKDFAEEFSQGFMQGFEQGFADDFGFDDTATNLVDEIEQQTGLRLPDDLVTLLGRSMVLSVGGDAPFDLDAIDEPGDVPVALTVSGDTAAIEDVLSRLEHGIGGTLEDLGIVRKSRAGHLTLATSEDYADAALANGRLGSDPQFRAVVPHADRASTILFLRIHGDWLTSFIRADRKDYGDEDADRLAADTAPLDALGFSIWQEGKVAHALLKLTLR
jgi:hypothetical protein